MTHFGRMPGSSALKEARVAPRIHNGEKAADHKTEPAWPSAVFPAQVIFIYPMNDAGYSREEPGAGKPAPGSVRGQSQMAELLDRDRQTRVRDWRHGRGQPRHKAILVPAACCPHCCATKNRNPRIPKNSPAIPSQFETADT